MMLSRRFALASVVALTAAPALAADPQAVAPIQALNQALLSAMKAGKNAPFSQRYQIIAPAVDSAFDLPTILRSSVGLRWASIPPTDQARLLDAFRKFTVTSYAANFDSYSGERFDIVPSTRTVGQDQVVQTRIVGSDTTDINYLMHNTPSGWKAIDVLLNGSISQVAVNRSDWRSLLASGPGPLIDSLQKRTASLSGGAVH